MRLSGHFFWEKRFCLLPKGFIISYIAYIKISQKCSFHLSQCSNVSVISLCYRLFHLYHFWYMKIYSLVETISWCISSFSCCWKELYLPVHMLFVRVCSGAYTVFLKYSNGIWVMKINFAHHLQKFNRKTFCSLFIESFLIFVCYSFSLLYLDLFYGKRITKFQYRRTLILFQSICYYQVNPFCLSFLDFWFLKSAPW